MNATERAEIRARHEWDDSRGLRTAADTRQQIHTDRGKLLDTLDTTEARVLHREGCWKEGVAALNASEAARREAEERLGSLRFSSEASQRQNKALSGERESARDIIRQIAEENASLRARADQLQRELTEKAALVSDYALSSIALRRELDEARLVQRVAVHDAGKFMAERDSLARRLEVAEGALRTVLGCWDGANGSSGKAGPISR